MFAGSIVQKSVPHVRFEKKASPDRKRVVIVGAGFAGLAAAKALGNSSFDVTVIDRHNYHLFQPLSYQVATAGLSPADIASPIRSILSGYKNTHVILADVSAIDLDERSVIAEDRRVPYDILVLATGAQHAYFGHDDWSAHAPGLKLVDDATYLRRRILVAFERAEAEPDVDRQRGFLKFRCGRRWPNWR
jgi:NADH dehydrogenase